MDQKCPEERPNFNTPCEFSQESVQCNFGTQECCGEIYPVVTMECNQGTWIGYYVDTLCLLGLAPPCPDDDDSSSSTIPDDTCPEDWPEVGSACSHEDLSCPYDWEECCGDLVPDVIFECDNGEWMMMWVDSYCDIGIPCPTTT